MKKKENSYEECGEASLDTLRNKIDGIDSAIVELLQERATCSVAVGKYKAKHGGPVLRLEREREVLHRLSLSNKGSALPNGHLAAIYREIFSSSRALQAPLRVTYLGPEGTFSHVAAMRYLGSGISFIPVSNFKDIFASVEAGDSDFGVVPLENSLHGTVGQSVDLFAVHKVFIKEEWFSRITLSLLGKTQDLKDISTVFSHSQPLGQCSSWLHANLNHARQESVESTALAAKKVLSNDHSAAIGHKILAELNGLHVLAEGIEDLKDNWTRFCLISSEKSDLVGNKATILFTLVNAPGSLSKVLSFFAKEQINLTKLESRPTRQEKWQYNFIADLQSSLTPEELEQALNRVKKICLNFRLLGLYTSGEYIS